MSTRTRNWLIALVGLILAALAIFLIYWFAIRDNSVMRITRIPPQSEFTLHEYRYSSLQLHSGGVFNIEIIVTRDNEPQITDFVGHGTWRRSGNTVYLTFTDAWGWAIGPLGANILIQDPEGRFVGEEMPFARHGRGLRFRNHNNQYFYFS